MPRNYLVKTTTWCIGLMLAACGHPATGGSGSAGSDTPAAGAAGGSGTGGVAGSSGNGAGGSSGNGSGGTSNDTDASVGSGGNSAGAGGSGEVVITPDAGTVVPAQKVACTDSLSMGTALKYTPGYVITDAAKTAAANAVANMNLTQKADQLRGRTTTNYEVFDTPDTATLKGWKFHDGPRGVDLDQTKTSGPANSTAFPVAMSRGASFDVDLEYAIGQAMGDEMVASGATMILAPTVNILRHPAWGRAQETYGEDSFLLGRLGTAFTVGVQEYVPACVKHFAANNIEKDRASAVALIDDQTLHDVYARHFGMIVQDGGVSCVMAAYNSIQLPGGTPEKCTQNKHLLTDILRTEFGFKGFVLTDWWAMPGGNNPDQNARAGYASTAIKAGLDLELPWNLNYAKLEASPDNTEAINTAALRVVTEKFRFKVNAPGGPIGLKSGQTKTSYNAATQSITNNDENIALAQKAAVEGAVLLKNDNNTLPIKATVRNVAVIGAKVSWTLQIGGAGSADFATDVRTGDRGSSRVNNDLAKSIGPFDGIKTNAPAGTTVVTSSGDSAGTAAAVQAADFVVIVAGLTPEDEGEEYTISPKDSDRSADMGLDGKSGGVLQDNFIAKYAAQATAANKPVVVVLEGGSSIDMPWLGSVPAVVMAWYPGQVGGAALGQLLFGKANFSGKLPLTWPKATADEPVFSGANFVTQMGYNLGYRWFDTQGKVPLFPFGHGLSYTTFKYANVQVPCSTATAKSVVNATVDVTNTGTARGDEVVLLFVSYPGSKLTFRPANYKELKGFVRVALNAGETKRVTIPIRVPDLSYFDTSSKAWKVEPGQVKVMIGPSAAADKLAQSDTFTVQ